MPDRSLRDTHSVILVRKPLRIIDWGLVPFPTLPAPKFRENILRWLLTLANKNEGRADGSNFIYVDVAYEQRVFRVFSLYFMWSSLAHRERAWDRVRESFSSMGPNILCGDFNIFDTVRGSILNWFLESKLSEIMPPDRNRRDMEHMFWRWGLYNPLDGIITHKSFAGNMQLDHILLPRYHTEIISKGVEKFDSTGRFNGSDHLLARVSFNFVPRSTQ